MTASGIGLKVGLQDERALPVAASRLHDIARRRQQPAAMIRRAQQRGETRRRVEARQAKPVDGPVAGNQRRRLAVADQGVVFNPRRHEQPSSVGVTTSQGMHFLSQLYPPIRGEFQRMPS